MTIFIPEWMLWAAAIAFGVPAAGAIVIFALTGIGVYLTFRGGFWK